MSKEPNSANLPAVVKKPRGDSDECGFWGRIWGIIRNNPRISGAIGAAVATLTGVGGGMQYLNTDTVSVEINERTVSRAKYGDITAEDFCTNMGRFAANLNHQFAEWANAHNVKPRQFVFSQSACEAEQGDQSVSERPRPNFPAPG